MKEKTSFRVPMVLSIAGFDGSAGAGIQADNKTIGSLGCYAVNVLSALPIQNSQGVKSVFALPPAIFQQQLISIFEDCYPDVIKIGMLYQADDVAFLAEFLQDYRGKVLMDPVMISSSGHRLMEEDCLMHVKQDLFPLVDLLTPNLPEISFLLGETVKELSDMERIAVAALDLGTKAVLLKGGHLDADVLSSILVQRDKDLKVFETQRIDSRNTHGTGCTLSSAIASYLALGEDLETACEKGIFYTHQAIAAAVDLEIGKGNGPLNHAFDPQKLLKI